MGNFDFELYPTYVCIRCFSVDFSHYFSRKIIKEYQRKLMIKTHYKNL